MLPHVLSIAQRIQICKWMFQTVTSSPEGSKNLASRSIRQFPALFRGKANEDIQKTTRIWKDMPKYIMMDTSDYTTGWTLLSHHN